MSTLESWGDVLAASFAEVFNRFVDLMPNIIGAIIIFIVGLFIAEGLGRVISKILQQIYVDQAVDKAGLKKVLENIGFKLTISRALGLLVTWFLYAVVLIGTAEILHLDQISQFLQAVVLYIPHVIVAVIILVVGIVVSNFVFTLVKEASLAAKLRAADFLATVAKWAILVFTFMAALVQLKVATELIQILFTGFVLMFSLAGGIAFGLGGKDKAKELLDKLNKK